jgi:hypothetical protein
MSSSTRCSKRRLTSRRCASCALSQEKQQAPPGGMRLQQLDKIYVDVITRRRTAHTRSRSTCPSLRSSSSTASACRWPRRCRRASSDAVHDGVEHRDQTVGRRRVSRRAGADSRRVGAGRRRSTLTNVAVQNWRRAPTTSCSPARGAASRSPVKLLRQGGVLDARSRRPRSGGAPARSAAAQEHRVGFRGISGRADALLPRERAGVVWLAQVSAGQVAEREARAAVCLSAAPPLFCTRRRSCTATSKPANLLVFSLSSSETVVA